MNQPASPQFLDVRVEKDDAIVCNPWLPLEQAPSHSVLHSRRDCIAAANTFPVGFHISLCPGSPGMTDRHDMSARRIGRPRTVSRQDGVDDTRMLTRAVEGPTP